MSRVTTPPVNAPKKDVNQLETVWIDWLNRSKGGKASGSDGYKDFENKRGFDLLSDSDLKLERFNKLKADIDVEMGGFEVIRQSLASETVQQVEKLETQARIAVNKDLSVPKNNEIALAAISKLKQRISLACKDEMGSGSGALIKDIAVLENSAEFKAADSLSGGSCAASLTQIKDIFKINPIKITNGQKLLADLKKTCQDTVRSHTDAKAKIDLAVTEYQRVAALAGTKKLSTEALGPFHEYLEKAAVLLRTANRAEPVAPPDATAGKLEKSVRDYGVTVQGFLDQSKVESDKAEKFANDFALIGNDPAKKKTFAELTTAQDAIAANYDAAVNAGMVANDQKKIDCLGYEGATVTTVELTGAKDFAAAIELAFDALYAAWGVEKTKHAKLIKFGLQLSASTTETADEDLGEVDQRSAAAKQMQAKVAWCLEKYDGAIALAKTRMYQEAIDGLKLAVAGDSTHKGLATLQSEAGDALRDTKADPQDLKDREEAFTTALGDVTDKSRIRFDKDAMDLMMGAGVTADEDGNLVYSDQFKAMQAQLEKGLTMWHGLCDKGVDPFKAAERAFEGIPENFWPPEAVRVIALFRKAEAEFASEREAAELQAEIQNGGLKKLDKAIDYGGLIAQHGAERAKDAADGMMAVFKTELLSKIGEVAFKKLQESDIQKMAKDHYKEVCNIDIKAATDVMGGLAAGIGGFNAGYKIGKGIGEISDKTQEIDRYDPETDSPVKLKMNEFERQRAIWHLINDMADAIVSALGPASQAVPALSILGDCKALVLDTIDALQYFTRLREVKAIKSTAKLDPETLAELALANEAEKLGLLKNQKTFDAAMALIKVVGGGVELGGITAAAGFGIKAGGTVLQYCGKGVFALIKWNDRRNAIKILLAARANPTDILYVEPVFEKCTMYSRYLLADGALNGDTWCRRYIISRGVTDTDLDNPNTSCAILREYLNVTFEVMSGDAQEDDDLGTAKKEKKEKAKQPSEEVDYTGTWQASDVNADATSFENNYKGALGADLAPNPKGVKRVKKVLQDFSDSLTQTTDLIDEFDKAYEEFEKAIDTKPLVQDSVDNAAKAAEDAMQAALNQASHTAGCVSACSGELVTGFLPLSNKKDDKKKPKVHAAFQTYLRELRESVALEYDPIADFRDAVSKKAMSLALKMKTDDDNFVESAQNQFKELAESLQQEINRANVAIEKSINDQWDVMTISSKTGGKGTKVKMIKNAATKLKVGEPEITSAVDKRFNAVKRPIVQTALGIGAKVTAERLSKLEEANKEKDEKKRKKQVKKIEEEAKKRIQKEAVEFSIEKAKQLLASEFDAAVGEVFATKAPATAKYVHTAPLALTREYWHGEKDRLKAKRWKFVKTGVGPAAEAYQEAKKNWDLLPKDDRLQGEYNGAYGGLLKKLNNIPLATEDGVELPGMKAMKTGLIAMLKEEKAEFDRRIVDPNEEDPKQNQSDGWVVSDSKLRTWPITQDGWVLMHDLAEKHGWEGHNSKRSLGKYFRHFGEARQEFQDATESTEKETAKGSARKYADELKKELAKWDPNKKMLRTKPAHKGIMKYKDVTITVLTELLAGELKA